MTPIKKFSSIEEMEEEYKRLLDEGCKPADGKYPSDYMLKLRYDPNIRIFRGELTLPFTDFGNRKFPSSGFYIHDYYPKNRCPNVDSNIELVRNMVYRFKDGNNTKEIVSLFTDAIIRKGLALSDTVLIIIPASTQEKTDLRYKSFCSLLCGNLKVINGYNSITTDPHQSTKGQSGGDKVKFFHFNNELYKGKRVLLVDDVYTSGTTFKQVCTRLFETGAVYVMGVFLAKTF